MIVRYTSYRFNKPPIIGENEYKELKHNFGINNNFDPFPNDGFIDNFKGMLKILACAIIATLIGDRIKQLEFIAIIGVLVLFGFLFGGPTFEMISYANYLRSRNSYYRKLKRNIINSNTYEAFVSNYR